MKLHYYPETDSLYIELTGAAGADVVEVADGLVVDIDRHGNPVGIDIDRASERLDLTAVETVALPVAGARGHPGERT